MHRLYANRIKSRSMSRVFCDLRSQKTPRGILSVNSNNILSSLMLSKKQALPLFQRQCLCIFLFVYSALFTGYSASAASSGSASITSWNLSRMIVWILSRVAELIGCAISRYSPSVALRLGIAINNPFSPLPVGRQRLCVPFSYFAGRRYGVQGVQTQVLLL